MHRESPKTNEVQDKTAGAEEEKMCQLQRARHTLSATNKRYRVSCENNDEKRGKN